MKNVLKKIRSFLKYKIFIVLEKYFKIHITKANYYSPIPELSKLNKNDYGKIQSSALKLDKNKFKLYLNQFEIYLKEYMPLTNPGLSRIDSFILFSTIRRQKPKKIIEIGSGFSTKVILSALDFNKKELNLCKLISVEPYPKTFLKEIERSDFQLLTEKIQHVDLDLFKDADILFIDSSHVSKFNSDVNMEIFQIIPKLKKGAYIHWHDIMIPNDYPEYWIKDGNKFWNENYLVHAFMLFNESFEILWPSRFMQDYHPEIVKEFFEEFDENNLDDQLSSFWVRRIK